MAAPLRFAAASSASNGPLLLPRPTTTTATKPVGAADLRVAYLRGAQGHASLVLGRVDPFGAARIHEAAHVDAGGMIPCFTTPDGPCHPLHLHEPRGPIAVSAAAIAVLLHPPRTLGTLFHAASSLAARSAGPLIKASCHASHPADVARPALWPAEPGSRCVGPPLLGRTGSAAAVCAHLCM
ncbi:hypothetical protein DAEQUDRAFT_409560 [Daedalea quercina L-15889]|uniref:Uncharacterized protein n=1 Tax=Daedalea quercina L-15889 TaxID=1314783 RepID=A0A165NKA4_9APHY|nr:hypothetical protein DAEQUDRAFT_409560 [Daedalea quercina L-15889]